MPTQTTTEATVEQKIEKLKELFADAPEIGKAALKKGLPLLQKGFGSATAQTAGRVGARQGKVSELTGVIPFVPGGAKRLRAFLELLGGNFRGADVVGTVHDMRFVFLDNDTKLLFATTYDGDWDPYMDDLASRIPEALDMLFCNCEGFPGMHDPSAKEWIAKHQSPAASWYVANPDLTVAETWRMKRANKALEEFLDKIDE